MCLSLGIFASVEAAEGLVPLSVDGEPLAYYQSQPLTDPVGGAAYKGSNFIHPLKTPSGFVVSRIQPDDHLHHFGLWWPWKYIEMDGRSILFWELQREDGIIEAVGSEPIEGGIEAKSVYLDRKNPGGATVILEETSRIKTSGILTTPARGYNLDVEISHRTVGDRTLTVTPYRYSGFSFRGTENWHMRNSTILTSAGEERATANFSYAKWVLVQGKQAGGSAAGVLLMSNPRNPTHPEKLRTWADSSDGAAFINFNTVGDDEWVFEPDKDYVRNFRVYVFDGEISAEQAETVWQTYSDSVK